MAHEVAGEVAADASASKVHRPETVAGRLAYLVTYSGIEYLTERTGEHYRVTEDETLISC